MSQSAEDIEARLAAFIDNELDDAGRAEIEKHLVENPQHAALIKDLLQQRELLRGLPRSTAPADIFESIQGQMERRLLLDESAVAGGESRRPMFRRVLALAAVIALTATLALVIYSVLPSARMQSNDLTRLDKIDSRPAPRSEVALGEAAKTDLLKTESRKPESPPIEPPAAGLAVDSPGKDLRGAVPLEPTAGEIPSAAVATADQLAGAARPLEPRSSPSLREPRINEADVPRIRSAIAADGNGGDGARVLVFAADDPVDFQKSVSAVLSANNISYGTVAGGDAARRGGGFSQISPPILLSPAGRIAGWFGPATTASASATSAQPPLPTTGEEQVFVGRGVSSDKLSAINQALAGRLGVQQQPIPEDLKVQYLQLTDEAAGPAVATPAQQANDEGASGKSDGSAARQAAATTTSASLHEDQLSDQERSLPGATAAAARSFGSEPSPGEAAASQLTAGALAADDDAKEKGVVIVVRAKSDRAGASLQRENEIREKSAATQSAVTDEQSTAPASAPSTSPATPATLPN